MRSSSRLIMIIILALALVAITFAIAATTLSFASYINKAQVGNITVTTNANTGTIVNVCAQKVAPGTAHCNALIHRGILQSPSGNVSATAMAALALGDNGAYSPAYLQSAYNVPSLVNENGNGSGEIVAIVEAYDNPNLASDLAYYRNHFGLPSCPQGSVSTLTSGCTLQIVNQTGGTTLPAANPSWGLESDIDIDMVSAICPMCQILVVEANSSQISDLGTAVNTAVSMGATVVSNSYGSTEYANEVKDSALYFNHPGVALLAAAGDTGYGVQFPASSPNVVAVGGTTLYQTGDNGTRNATETAWSGTASGCSQYEPKPSWQHDTGCSMRSVVDVSAVANPNTGVWVYDSFQQPGLVVAGGTSVATPIVGSLYALANKTMPKNSQPVSFLYEDPGALVGVTSGRDGSCGTYLCDAGLSQNGYNGPTGLGTPGATPNSAAALTVPQAIVAPVLSANPLNGGVFLNWNQSPTSALQANVYYNVYSSTDASFSTARLINQTPVSATSLSIPGLTNASQYFFKVVATNGSGRTASSNVVSATPQAINGEPASPSNLTGVPGNNSVTLHWSASPAGQSPVTYYLASDGLGDTCRADVALGKATSCTISGLTNGTSYNFYVVAVNSVGQSAASLASAAITPETVPGAPSNVIAQPGDRQVTVSWTPPTDMGGANVSSYTVLGGEGNKCVATPTTNETDSCTVSGLTNGVKYNFVVRASNAAGTGPASKLSNSVIVSSSVQAVNVQAGYDFACALLQNGYVNCWGNNSYGQLGNGTTTNSTAPVTVKGLSQVKQIAVGAFSVCAVTTDTHVKCWGDNFNGQIGVSGTENVLTPATVPGLTSVAQISVGYDYACATSGAGTVTCWGANTYGQLGSAPTNNNVATTTISGLPTISQVSVSLNHTCALATTGSVYCWGDGSDGQLGNGALAKFSAPVLVDNITNATQVAVGSSFSCAKLTGGSVDCWGYNGDGELGNGTIVNSSDPVSVTSLSGVSDLEVSSYNACTTAHNSLMCWGFEANGLFGASGSTNVQNPIAITTVSNVVDVALGYSYDCSLTQSGTVQCWSTNTTQATSLWFSAIQTATRIVNAPVITPSARSPRHH